MGQKSDKKPSTVPLQTSQMQANGGRRAFKAIVACIENSRRVLER